MIRLTDADVIQIEERAGKATPGPWVWHGNLTGKRIELKSLGRLGKCVHPIVMIFSRWGMQSAIPFFRNREQNVMEQPVLVPSEPHNAWDIVAIDHPDAEFIAHSRVDVERLLADRRAILAELTDAQTRERTLVEIDLRIRRLQRLRDDPDKGDHTLRWMADSSNAFKEWVETIDAILDDRDNVAEKTPA